MPTPPVNRDSTISHLTAGTRQPYSIEAEATLRISARGRPPFSGVKPMSCMSLNATTNITIRMRPRSTKGTPRLVCSAMNPPATEPVSIAGSGDDLPAAEHRLQLAREARRRERVDEPRLDRAGEEREPQAEQHRGHRPLPERCLDLPEQHVEQGRRGQRHRAEQVRGAAPDRVGDDPGRHLEQHHPRGEEGVGGERLQVREPGVEQEDRVDPPDQRRRQRVPEQEQAVGALDDAWSRHGPVHVGRGPIGCITLLMSPGPCPRRPGRPSGNGRGPGTGAPWYPVMSSAERARGPRDESDFAVRLERHRRELQVHGYPMLGSSGSRRWGATELCEPAASTATHDRRRKNNRATTYVRQPMARIHV